MPCKESIMLFGPTGSGKTVQFGELALDEFMNSGGNIDDQGRAVGGLKSRLYTADGGGWSSIQHLVDLGIVDIVDMRPFSDKTVWEAWDRATKGCRYLGNKWSDPDIAGISMVGYEGATTVGDLFLKDMREGNAKGDRVIKGRGQDVAIRQGEFTYMPTNETMYGYAQSRLLDLIVQSQSIAGSYNYAFWSALAYRANDQDDNSLILGPQAAGKKLASEIPAKVTYTFRLQDLPADPMFDRPKPEHRLYLDAYKDDQSPGVTKVVGNSRIPLEVMEQVMPKGGYIAPASLPEALRLVHSAGEEARKLVVAKIRESYRKGGVKEARS